MPLVRIPNHFFFLLFTEEKKNTRMEKSFKILIQVSASDCMRNELKGNSDSKISFASKSLLVVNKWRFLKG